MLPGICCMKLYGWEVSVDVEHRMGSGEAFIHLGSYVGWVAKCMFMWMDICSILSGAALKFLAYGFFDRFSRSINCGDGSH